MNSTLLDAINDRWNENSTDTIHFFHSKYVVVVMYLILESEHSAEKFSKAFRHQSIKYPNDIRISCQMNNDRCQNICVKLKNMAHKKQIQFTKLHLWYTRKFSIWCIIQNSRCDSRTAEQPFNSIHHLSVSRIVIQFKKLSNVRVCTWFTKPFFLSSLNFQSSFQRFLAASYYICVQPSRTEVLVTSSFQYIYLNKTKIFMVSLITHTHTHTHFFAFSTTNRFWAASF